MTTAKISNALNEIDQSGLKRPCLDAKFAASDNEIKEAEIRLGYVFPESYRSFLRILGSVDFQATEFYELVPNQLDLEDISNGLWFTQDLRKNMDFFKSLFAFQDFDGDAVVCLMLSQIKDGECPVIFWDHSESYERQIQKPHILAETFGDYFFEKIKELIEYAHKA